MNSIRATICISFISFIGCSHSSPLSQPDKNIKQTIAFQPLDDFNVEEIQIVANEIGSYFEKRVVILAPIAIPTTYFSPVVRMYSADSIVMLLSKLPKGEIVQVIGLSHKPLYTLKEALPMPYYDTGILGFSHQPGDACVVTDNNSEVGRTLPLKRLRNNILHEIGHNMGLAHCSNQTCTMVKRNTGDDYCEECRKKVLN